MGNRCKDEGFEKKRRENETKTTFVDQGNK